MNPTPSERVAAIVPPERLVVTPTVFAALSAVMADVSHVGKDGRNEKQNYAFRGIDGVVNAVGPALRAHKVIVSPELLTYEYGSVTVGSNRTPMGHARVTVSYRFYGPAGDSITAIAPGEAMDSGDKATAKAMSVAFRTALLQALALPTNDPDPDATSYERSAPLTRAEIDERDRLTLLSQVTEAANAAKVPLTEIEADWAASHDGQFIGDATDVGSLELIRDDLRTRA